MGVAVDRATIIFHGTVQGVGFRYTVRRLAKTYPTVSGQVRNLSDGSVELIAEGLKANISILLQDILRYMNEYVSSTEQQWSTGPREYEGFSIGF